MQSNFNRLYMHYAWTRVGDTPIDTLLQFKTNEYLFRNEKCIVTFDVKYQRLVIQISHTLYLVV